MISQRGGRARSQAKTVANRAKAAAYWKAVRAGRRPAPRRRRAALDPGAIGRLLAECCRRRGIAALEVFGPIARGGYRPGGEVDLLATTRGGPGTRLSLTQGEMAAILGAPVHLLTRDSVDSMANPYRRASILAEATLIFREP